MGSGRLGSCERASGELGPDPCGGHRDQLHTSLTWGGRDVPPKGKEVPCITGMGGEGMFPAQIAFISEEAAAGKLG